MRCALRSARPAARASPTSQAGAPCCEGLREDELQCIWLHGCLCFSAAKLLALVPFKGLGTYAASSPYAGQPALGALN